MNHQHELELKLHPLVVVAILMIPTLIVAFILPAVLLRDVLAMLLFGIQMLYVGFAFSDSWRSVIIQSVAAVVFLILAVAGLVSSPWWLIIGLVAHGGWDYLHHVKVINTKVVSWYPPFCAVYDWLVAALIVVLLILR